MLCSLTYPLATQIFSAISVNVFWFTPLSFLIMSPKNKIVLPVIWLLMQLKKGSIFVDKSARSPTKKEEDCKIKCAPLPQSQINKSESAAAKKNTTDAFRRLGLVFFLAGSLPPLFFCFFVVVVVYATTACAAAPICHTPVLRCNMAPVNGHVTHGSFSGPHGRRDHLLLPFVAT